MSTKIQSELVSRVSEIPARSDKKIIKLYHSRSSKIPLWRVYVPVATSPQFAEDLRISFFPKLDKQTGLDKLQFQWYFNHFQTEKQT